jgi:hypothetical protein
MSSSSPPHTIVINPRYPLANRLHLCKSDYEIYKIILDYHKFDPNANPGYVLLPSSRKRISLDEYFYLHPPAPRLVGIELNPGPKPSNVMSLVKFFQQLGSLKGGLKQLLPPPSRLSKGGNNSGTKTKHRRRKRKKQSVPSLEAYVPFSKSTYASAPVAVATITRSISGPTHTSQPFRVLSSQVWWNGTNFFFTQDSGAHMYAGLQCSPVYTPAGFSNGPFARALQQIASGYVRFRCTKLIIEYRPAVSSSVPGNVVLGFTTDAYASNAGNLGSTIGTLTNSMSAAVWQPFDLPVKTTDLTSQGDDGWCYNYANVASASEEREDAFGALLIGSTISTTLSSGTLADIYISGIMEFKELGLESTLQ